MKGSRQIRYRMAVAVLASCVILGVAWRLRVGYRARANAPLYHDAFAARKTSEWKAYAGAWELYEGGIRNDSDERGAKFITGSLRWTDYSLEADIMLLGADGDAGLIVRSSDEEEGIDSYSGYYVGLRDRNSTLAMGRADHGWMEYETLQVPGGIRVGRWYHLKVVAVGCDIAASAMDMSTRATTFAAMHEENCARTGRIGLRSYSAGGIWKNVRVLRAAESDLKAIKSLAVPTSSPAFMQTESGYYSTMQSLSLESSKGKSAFSEASGLPAHPQPLESLRLVSSVAPPVVRVRGSVVLTSPVVFIEDPTGGIALPQPQFPPLKIGDEVEVTGQVEPRLFSPVLRNAIIQVRWAGTPEPPLSITASQAATGSFDAMFVQVEGYLRGKARASGESVVLNLRSGRQTFRALIGGKRQDTLFDKLKIDSLLRLRGVCAVDADYTHNLDPFVLLLRSGDDVEIVADPPWWNAGHIMASACVLLVLVLFGLEVYAKVKRWRFQAVLEERSRIAREIHDTLAQGFSGIALQLDGALEQLQHDVKTGITLIEMALQMTRRSRAEAHRSIAVLRALHSSEPLATILTTELTRQISGAHLALNVSVVGKPQRFFEEVEGQILRIAQEFVANTIQHAGAHRVDVCLEFAKQRLRMEMNDDGHGFDLSSVTAAQDGCFGLTGMRERAERIGADLVLQSSAKGTRMVLSVPCFRQPNLRWAGAREVVGRFFRMHRLPG